MTLRLISVLLALLAGWTMPARADLAALSNQDAVSGLKAALERGSGVAVSALGRTDGFFGNNAVKIPLPDSLKKYEKLMRGVGMGKQADELILTMNRAAEAAVPEAKTLLVNSIKQMSVEDAKAILTGGEDSATQYFKRTTSAPLSAKFKPIVAKAMAKVKLAEKYDQFAGKAAKYGLVKGNDANIEDYVTARALDGLYTMIAEEEKAIRRDPVSATGSLAKKVFGLLR